MKDTNNTKLVRFVQNLFRIFLCDFKQWFNCGRAIRKNYEADYVSISLLLEIADFKCPIIVLVVYFV